MSSLFFDFLQECFDCYKTLKPADVVDVHKAVISKNQKYFPSSRKVFKKNKE